MPKQFLSTQVAHITDTTDDNAKLKIRGAYALHMGRNNIVGPADVVGKPSTLEIGVVASELLTNTQRPDRLIIAVNCAPPDQKSGTTDNARRDFYCADLGDNATVSGTVNGLEMAYVRSKIKALYRLTTTNSKGSQFRSLEILPEIAIAFADPKRRAALVTQGILVREENIDKIIPTVPDRTHVIEVDNFFNAKLAIATPDRQQLERAAATRADLEISFANYSVELLAAKRIERQTYHAADKLAPFAAQATPTLFAAELGTNLIALRSSSRLVGGNDVPIIATMREQPAESQPKFPIPILGAEVFFNFAQPR